MPINEPCGFIYFGAKPQTNRTDYTVSVPYPTKDNAVFETSRSVDAARNGRGEMVGRMVGRSSDKQNMGWDEISCKKWWEINRFIENGHFSFYCHYFNFNLGYWQTKLFYAGNPSVTPYLINKADGIPKVLRNASLSVIDCGVI